MARADTSTDYYDTGAAPSTDAGGGFGGVYDTIADYYRRYLQREPTLAEVSQWGTNLDPAYLAKIENAVMLEGVKAGTWGMNGKATTPGSSKTGSESTTTGGTAKYTTPETFWPAWDEVRAQYPGTTAGLAQMVKEHPEFGVKIVGGSQGDILTPWGETVDQIIAAGKGGKGWTGNRAADTPRGGAGTAAAAPAFSYPYFEPPPFDAPSFAYPAFAEPTVGEFQADPGYEFARSEALRAAVNDASAAGLRRTGGFLKGLESYATGLANQSYDTFRNRRFQDWSANRDKAVTDYMVGYNREADEYNRARDVYGLNFNTAATSAGINQNANNALWNQRLSLYDLSTRNLPTYTPTVPNPS